MTRLSGRVLLLIIIPVLVFPVVTLAQVKSSNYQLKDYSFGTSGQQSSSANYQINGTAGGQTGSQSQSTNYQFGPGLSFDINANTPAPPTLTDQNRNYNKLHLVIDNGNNPTDTKYLIAISTDNFTTDTKYVQSDSTVSTSPVWQDYTAWGGATGIDVIGLSPSITYTVKISALQKNFTQSPFSAVTTPTCTCQAATSGSLLTFSASPNSVNIGTLTPATVVTSGTNVTVNLDTNAAAGGSVWVMDSNGGLLSSSTSHTITAGSLGSQNNLAAVSEGYGLQASSATQSLGGPISLKSPYNGGSNLVGAIGSAGTMMADSSNAPVTSGSWSFNIQAKASYNAPPATDYADTLTLVATADF